MENVEGKCIAAIRDIFHSAGFYFTCFGFSSFRAAGTEINQTHSIIIISFLVFS